MSVSFSPLRTESQSISFVPCGFWFASQSSPCWAKKHTFCHCKEKKGEQREISMQHLSEPKRFLAHVTLRALRTVKFCMIHDGGIDVLPWPGAVS